jgi:hypothetical protein
MTNHPAAWVIILEAVFGGIAVAAIGGVVFYFVGLLVLTITSALLPLAGGRPKILLDREKRHARNPQDAGG